MRRHFRRALSCLAALSMTLSMLPAPAALADGPDETMSGLPAWTEDGTANEQDGGAAAGEGTPVSKSVPDAAPAAEPIDGGLREISNAQVPTFDLDTSGERFQPGTAEIEITAAHDVLKNHTAMIEPEYSENTPEGATNSDSSDVSLLSSPGTYIGSYGSIRWTLNTFTGVLNVTGSGSAERAWWDQNGEFLGDWIQTVVLGEGITGIGYGAFGECQKLRSISIPAGVTGIGDYALLNCASLKSVSLPSSLKTVGYGSFAGCSTLSSVNIPYGVTKIDYGAFNMCSSLKEIILPSTVASVGDFAFDQCAALEKAVVYGDIGEYAFQNCTSLSELRLGHGLKNIGRGAFYSCTSLKAAILPETVEQIGFAAFADCSGLTEASTYGALGDYAFNTCTALTRLTIGPGCEAIGSSVFTMCEKLEEVEVPESCASFGEQAFAACTALRRINFPAALSSIGEACFYCCSSLERAEIPDGVTAIGRLAFGNCDKLVFARLPAGLSEIGPYCFQICKALETVETPDAFSGGLTELSAYLFTNCISLKGFDIPYGIRRLGDGVFVNCQAMEEMELPETIESVGGGIWGYCSALKRVYLPDSCKAIGDQAFYECESLVSVSLPQSLSSLGNAVFYNCSALAEIQIPNTVNTLGHHTFVGCETLSRIAVPSNVKTIGEYCFANCAALHTVTLPSALDSIPAGLFANCESLSAVAWPDGVTGIGDYAFYNCPEAVIPQVPDSVSSIGTGAFIHCLALTEFVLPSGVDAVPEAAFVSCENLVSVYFQGQITKIGDYAFADCGSLEAISIPSGVTEIGKLAFANCSRLPDPALPAGLTSIGEEAFANCVLIREFELGAQVVNIGSYAFSGCSALERFSVDSGNGAYCSIDGALYTANRSKLIAYPAARQGAQYTPLSALTELAEGAFYGCDSLTEILLPDSLEKIPDRLFYGCKGLTSVALPAHISEIGDYAFANCENLETVRFTNDLMTRIGQYAFAWCASLGELSLPSSITELGEGAFAECDSLRSLSIPGGVEHIRDFLLYGCEKIEHISFQGNIFAIGNAAFMGDALLESVTFAGNAPEVIGTECFSNTCKDLVFYYNEAADGWSAPSWTGPDHVTYQTATTLSSKCGDNLNWVLSTYDGQLTILGSGKMFTWSGAGNTPWSEYRDLIRSVEIGQGVTSIGSCAFMGCKNLSSASLPNSVEEIGYAAFADCIALRSVEASGGLRDTGACMFYGCQALEKIALHEAVKEIAPYSFFRCSRLSSIRVPGQVTTIEEGAFAECVSLTQVILEGTVDRIASGAFLGCENLDLLVMAADVPETAEAKAFAGVNGSMTVLSSQPLGQWTDGDGVSFRSVTALSGNCGAAASWVFDPVTATLTVRGSGAVENYGIGTEPWANLNTYVNAIVIEEGITAVGRYAFEGMEQVTSVSLPESLASIGSYAFADCTSLRDILLPSGLTELGEGAFCGCVSMRSIAIPSGVTELKPYTFMLCASLASVQLSPQLRGIGYGAFYLCTKADNISFPSGLKSIDDWAFAHCVGLSGAALPDSLTELGEYAFYDCTLLTELCLSSSLTEIAGYAFSQTGLPSVAIPDGITAIGKGAFELCEQLSSVIFPSGMTALGESSFYGCKALTAIDLKQVRKIGKMAFMSTGLRNVLLPETVSSVGLYAFADCGELTGIVSRSPSYPTQNGVLYHNSALYQYPAGKAEKTFEVIGRATEISEGAFYGASHLVGVTLGNQVVQLGKASFALCGSLETVSMKGNIRNLSEAVFGDCPKLTGVYLFGDSPAVESDAFYGVNDNLTLYWNVNASGWTEGAWVGSDGVTYRASSFQPAHSTVKTTAKAATCTEAGNQEYWTCSECHKVFSDEACTMETTVDAMTIPAAGHSTVKTNAKAATCTEAGNKEYWTCTGCRKVFSDEACTIENVIDAMIIPAAGHELVKHDRVPATEEAYGIEAYWKCGACEKLFSDADGQTEIEEPIIIPTLSHVPCALELTQLSGSSMDGQEFALSVQTGAGEPVDGTILIALYQDGKMSSVCSVKQTLNPNQTYLFRYRALGNLDETCVFRAFLLDAFAYAPLAAEAEMVCSVQHTGGEPSVQLIDSSEQSAFVKEKSTELSDLDTSYGSLLTTYAAAETESGQVPYTTTTLTYHYSDIFQLAQDSLNNSLQKPEISTKAQTPVSIGISMGSTSKPVFDNQMAVQSFVKTDGNGEILVDGTTNLAHAAAVMKLSLSGARFDHGKFVMPQAKANGVVRFNVVDTSAERRSWNIGNIKIRQTADFTLLGAEVSGDVGLDISKEVTLGAKGEVNVAEAATKFAICDSEGAELVSLSLGAGVGAGGNVSAGISKDSIKLKFGAKAGIGGSVGLNVRPVNLTKAILKSDAVQNAVNHFLIISAAAASGNVDMLACYYYETTRDGNLITSLIELPIACSLLTAGVVRAALPKSNGGERMPSQSDVDSVTGSEDQGNTSQPVPGSNLTQENKEAIMQEISAANSTIQQIMNQIPGGVALLEKILAEKNIPIGKLFDPTTGITHIFFF